MTAPNCSDVSCILCGHDGHPDDGEYDPVDGDWYCEPCGGVASAGETPVRGVPR